uniref:Cupin 2 conserved barrel domain-containing protein n=1 Tax=Erwinia amylovora ATCC BAA-2158 TaxID=889211 RepID=E5BAG4_ERWAM|nr:hypothetical protein EAIL5_3651 [Erwinia amylovora ATCC BAA-2158]
MKRSTLHAVALICGFGVIASAGASTQLRAVPGDSHETTVSDGKIQPPVKFSTVWADDKGATHVGHCRFEGLEHKSYAPPSAPQWIGLSPDEVESIAYAVLPPGYVGSWHHAPGPQWVITLSGKWSVETTDGSTLVQGPGEVQFNADTSSRPRPGDDRVGHVSRTVGDEPNVQLIIKLKPGIDRARTRGSCAY